MFDFRPRDAVILLGPPASGKTSVADEVARHDGVTAIRIDDELQRCAGSNAAMAALIRPFVDAGRPVPSDLVETLLTEAIAEQPADHIVFDGFPLTEAEFDSFFTLALAIPLSLRAVLILNLQVEEALERAARGKVCVDCGAPGLPHERPSIGSDEFCECCGGPLQRRPGGESKAVRRRFQDYQRETQPVIERFSVEFPYRTHQQSGALPIEQTADRVVRWLRLESDPTHRPAPLECVETDF